MKRYEYRIPKWQGFACVLFFGLFTYLSLMKALNGGTLSFKRMQFSETFTQYFAWGSVVLFGLLALFGVFAIVKSFGEPQIVRLYEDKIVAPKAPYSNQINTIFYRDITQFTLNQMGKNKQLIIRDDRQKIVFSQMNFDDKSDFDEIVQHIQQQRRLASREN